MLSLRTPFYPGANNKTGSEPPALTPGQSRALTLVWAGQQGDKEFDLRIVEAIAKSRHHPGTANCN